jgi:sigma-B regulation protein RsbU (phosphoserine phosphatase)
MIPRRHLGDLDLELVLAPFRAVAGRVLVRIEDDRGVALATSGSDEAEAVEGRYRAIAPITVHDEGAGRVVVDGPSADPGLLEAAAGSLAAALSLAVATGIDQTASSSVTPADLEAELAHGRRLQRSFVSLVPPDVPGYDIATHYEAAREVGGDFFDLFRLRRRGRPLSLVIADVTGKGIAAALLMAFARPLLHAAIDHTMDPATALERTNAVFVGERRTSLFITALCARLDVGTGRLLLANAGHEPPLFIPADGSAPGLILGSGPLLGAFPELGLPCIEAWMAPGDVCLFYTDGVTDAQARDGTRFDERGLLAAVARGRGGTAQDVIDAIVGDLEAFTAGGEPADDITMVALGRRRAG